MSRTGLILRHWVEREGCYIIVKQAYAYDTGYVVTSLTEVLCVFKFHNEWRAALCEARMNNSRSWEAQERAWKKYFSTMSKISWWAYHKETIATDGTFGFVLKFLLFFGLVYFLLT